MSEKRLITVLVATTCLLAGALLGSSGIFAPAEAAMQGQVGGVIALIGDETSQEAPLVIVDVPDETVIIYEYDYQNEEIELTAARTFRYDKLLTDFPSDHKGPSVEEVRRGVTR